MAITNIGLSVDSAATVDGVERLCLAAGAPDAPVYLKWRTLSGEEFNASFDIAFNYRFIPRGVSGGEDNGYTEWKTDWSTWTNVKVGECAKSQLDETSGWQWSLDLATLLDRCGIKEAFTDDSDFGFGSRKFDRAEIGIHIKSQYKSGYTDASGVSHSPRTDTVVMLDYVPSYRIESVYCDTADEVKIEYSANGWERLDDRWCIDRFDTSRGSLLLGQDLSGTVVRHDHGGNGAIIVPVSSLTSHPVGEAVSVSVRFGPSYAAADSSLATAAAEKLTCQNNAQCNTPLLAAIVSDGAVHVTVGDSGDKGRVIESCLIKLDGGRYRFDQQTVKAGETAVFPYVPRDVPLRFTAIASGSRTISTNATVDAEPIPIGGAVVLASLRSAGARAVAKWDVSLAESYSPSMVAVKLAGRARPCAYYGEGGVQTWNLSFGIVSSEATAEESDEAWRNVSKNGDCVMLLPGGRRSVVAPSSLQISRRNHRYASASMSLAEVDA